MLDDTRFIRQSHSVSFGGIAGQNEAMIRNSRNLGNINGYENVGGIAGKSIGNSAVVDCYNAGVISGRSNVGGLVGITHFAKISGSYNTGNVNGGYKNTGGITGYCLYSTVKQSYNTGNIYGETNVGGIAGKNNNSTITQCFNTANISCEDNVAGIAGKSFQATVSESYNLGDISAYGTVGGINGHMEHSYVKNCYNAGTVFSDQFAAGIAGYYTALSITGNISNCVSLGKKVSSSRVVNGYGVFTNNKARKNMIVIINGIVVQVSGTSSNTDGENTPFGTELSDVFFNWDTSIWKIPNGSLHPNCKLPTLRNIQAGVQNPRLE